MVEVVNFRMNKEIKDNFKRICKNQNISMSNRLNFLILDFLENFKIEKKVENKKVVKKNTKIVDWRDELYVG
tara:strand:+ start:327 stop:542 length:216 start_codon:yes stop_codon:yes gene_type:complete